MSYQNFIPTVWAETINRDLERLAVFAEDCNRQYEGQVSEKGDSVKILGVGKPTIRKIDRAARNNAITAAEEIEDQSIFMPINQISYFNYKVGDIDKHAAVDGLMGVLSQETSEGLAQDVDKYLADLGKSADTPKIYSTGTTGYTITNETIMSVIDGAIQKLYENDVPRSAQIVLTLDPKRYFLLKQAYAALDTDNSAILKNGKVGMYGNVIVKMSNNISTDATNAYLMIRTQRACAFVHAMTHTEPYRPENGFADAVKGFILYDAKVVRPKEIFSIVAVK